MLMEELEMMSINKLGQLKQMSEIWRREEVTGMYEGKDKTIWCKEELNWGLSFVIPAKNCILWPL